MIKLESFKIFGFKESTRFAEVNFSKLSASVIYGANGSGKTSFLKAISAFFSQDDAALATLGVKSIVCTFLHENVRKTVEVEKKEISYNWSKLVESPLKDARSLSLGVERGISTQSLRIEPDLIFEFFRLSPRGRRFFQKNNSEFSPREFSEELSLFLRRRQTSLRDRKSETDFSKAHENLQNIKLENIEELLLNHYKWARYSANLRIQSALFNTLSDAIDSKELLVSEHNPNNLYSSIINYRVRLIEALTDESTESNHFKKKIIRILEALTEDNYTVEIENKPLLLSLFQNMIEELEKEKLALGSINLLVEMFNKYLINDKKLIISNTEIYISIGQNQHSIHDLSSGERHILTFLSLVLFQGQGRDFLIIDEPEISLNIVWQRELLDLFTQLVPNTQIIVASHSPVLSKRNPDFLTPLTTGLI